MADVVESSLLELERAAEDSLCNATGAEFYAAIMMPDALMVLANGMVMDRDTVVASLSKSPPWRAYDIDDVRLIDADNAVLVYIGTAYRDGKEPAFVGAMTSAYHRTDQGWKLALYTQTRQG